MDLMGQLIALVQRGVRLGVGIGAGLEIAVGLFLDGNDVSLDADAAEQLPHGLVAGAAQGGIHHMEAGALDPLQVHALLHDPVIVGVPKAHGDVLDEALGLQRVEALLRKDEIRGILNLPIHHRGGLVGHLAAVLAIALDAVVDAGVVGGSHHDAAAAAQRADGIGEHGSRGQLVVDMYVDAGLRQGGGADLGIGSGIVTAVIADGAALGQLRPVEPLGNALCRAADRKLIETIAAQAHNAADAGSTEGQLRAEALLQRRVAALHGLEHIPIGNRGVFQPKLILSQIIHCVLPKAVFCSL